ncbi:MAG: alpha/beta fold hydrolase [Anaerolineae bacterium]
MRSTLFRLIALLTTLWALAACGAASEPTTAPTEAVLVTEATPTARPPTTVAPTPTAVPAFTATFEEAPCPMALPEGAVEGRDIRCGYVSVPERHALPQGKTIRLAAAVIPSASNDPHPDPLVMLSGGPGESALTAFTQLLALPGMERLWAQRDVVLVEQRGTMYTTPFLQCPDMLAVKLDMMRQNLSEEEEDALRLQAWADCRDQFVASGVDLAAYNSIENAADIVTVADALGYEQVNLYGGSYGSLLAQHVMRDYPARVRSAVLSDVSPLRHGPNMREKALSMDRALRMLFAQCAADEACNQAYPDLEAVYWDLVAQLDESPATLELTDPNTGETHEMVLTGERLVAATRNLLYLAAALPRLPSAIYDMAEGDFSLVALIESRFTFSLGLADGMYNSVVCSELADVSRADMIGPEGLYPQVSAVVADLVDDIMLQPCPVWGVEHLGDALDQSLVSEIPTLLLSGEFDPTVPPHLAEVAAEGLANAYLFTFPGMSHGILGSGACAHDMMLAFLDDPAQAPDASCLDAMPGLAFHVPPTELALEPFVDEARGFRGLVPSGWQALGPANLARASSVNDPAYFVLEAQPVSAAELFTSLAGQLGLDPEAEPTIEAPLGALTWQLYDFEIQSNPLDLALAEDGGKAYFVLLISPAGEHEAMYEQLFLPAVEAMEPLG